MITVHRSFLTVAALVALVSLTTACTTAQPAAKAVQLPFASAAPAVKHLDISEMPYIPVIDRLPDGLLGATDYRLVKNPETGNLFFALSRSTGKNVLSRYALLRGGSTPGSYMVQHTGPSWAPDDQTLPAGWYDPAPVSGPLQYQVSEPITESLFSVLHIGAVSQVKS